VLLKIKKLSVFFLLLGFLITPSVAFGATITHSEYTRTPTGATPTSPLSFTRTTSNLLTNSDGGSSCNLTGFPNENQDVLSMEIWAVQDDPNNSLSLIGTLNTTQEMRDTGVFSADFGFAENKEIWEIDVYLYGSLNGSGAYCFIYGEYEDTYTLEKQLGTTTGSTYWREQPSHVAKEAAAG